MEIVYYLLGSISTISLIIMFDVILFDRVLINALYNYFKKGE